MKRLILASTSPRRRELMERLGVPFEAYAPRFHEAPDAGLSPESEAQLFAREKALSLSRDFPGAVIVGSDTLVELDGEKLGKPADPSDAVRMLSKLSGRRHRVLTALAIVDCASGAIREKLCVAEVWMKALTREEILAYVESGEPMDKAGAYAVQGLGGQLVKTVKGDLLTVVGLPLRELAEMLLGFGMKGHA